MSVALWRGKYIQVSISNACGGNIRLSIHDMETYILALL